MHSPSAADVVATLLAGSGTAHLTSALTGARAPALQAFGDDGTPYLVVRDADVRSLGLVCAADDVAAELQITSGAPLPDAALPRADVQITRWVSERPAGPAAVTEPLTAHSVGDLDEILRDWPDARLLTLDPAEITLHWVFGCTDVPVEDLSRARPDPLARDEADALPRIDAELGPRLLRLTRSMGHARSGAGTTLDLCRTVATRAIALDRWGVVLRCVIATDDGTAVERNVRLPFPTPADTVDDALDTLALLLLEHEHCPGICPHSGHRFQVSSET